MHVSHCENNHPRSLLPGTLFIDLDTANNLELLKSNLDHKPKNSLFGKRQPNYKSERELQLTPIYT